MHMPIARSTPVHKLDIADKQVYVAQRGDSSRAEH